MLALARQYFEAQRVGAMLVAFRGKESPKVFRHQGFLIPEDGTRLTGAHNGSTQNTAILFPPVFLFNRIVRTCKLCKLSVS